jgi:hypothetical protein
LEEDEETQRNKWELMHDRVQVESEAEVEVET